MICGITKEFRTKVIKKSDQDIIVATLQVNEEIQNEIEECNKGVEN